MAANARPAQPARSRIIAFLVRVVALTLLLFVARIVVSAAVGLFPPVSAEPLIVLPGFLAGAFLYSVVFGYVLTLSHWHGVRLGLLAFWLVFGISTLLAQVESVVFLQYLVNNLSADMLAKSIEQATLYALCCGVLVPVVHANLPCPAEQPAASNGSLAQMRVGGWTRQLAAIAVIYLVIYLAAGLFILRNPAGPAFDEYYRGLQLPSWIVPFQFARALLWVAVAVPLLQAVHGKRWQVALAVALSFSLLMSAFLFTPSSVMPDRIRLSHFVELVVSNFGFGWIVAWLLTRASGDRQTHGVEVRPEPTRELVASA